MVRGAGSDTFLSFKTSLHLSISHMSTSCYLMINIYQYYFPYRMSTILDQKKKNRLTFCQTFKTVLSHTVLSCRILYDWCCGLGKKIHRTVHGRYRRRIEK